MTNTTLALKLLFLKIQITKVTPMGFEPMIFWMKTKYPRPLDDGATVFLLKEQEALL